MDSILTQKSSYSYRSVRKSDVEEAKKNAEECTKALEEISNDRRLESIPKQIKENQENIDKIKRNIATHEDLLSELRKHAEQQQTVATLQKEIEKETTQLEELIDDSKPEFRKASITVGSIDLQSIETLCMEIDGKKKSATQRLGCAQVELSEKQMRVAESTTTIDHCSSSLAQLQNRIVLLDDTKITLAHQDIRTYEEKNKVTPIANAQLDPKELLGHIDRKLAEIEESNNKSPESVVRIISKLKNMVSETLHYIKIFAIINTFS